MIRVRRYEYVPRNCVFAQWGCCTCARSPSRRSQGGPGAPMQPSQLFTLADSWQSHCIGTSQSPVEARWFKTSETLGHWLVVIERFFLSRQPRLQPSDGKACDRNEHDDNPRPEHNLVMFCASRWFLAPILSLHALTASNSFG